jgi:hypothetical protein
MNSRTKKHPDREQQASGLVRLIPSVKQSRCWRGPAGRQLGGNRCSRFLIQVSEYLLDHHQVFDAGDDAHITTAFTAGFNAQGCAGAAKDRKSESGQCRY